MSVDKQHERRRILILGANGQVGWELVRTLAPLGDVTALDRSVLNVADLKSVTALVRTMNPAIVVNAAAYTAVDKAESEPELAMRLNGELPHALAQISASYDSLLVHFSTDYVFDGTATRAYVETDATNPKNVYGQTKLAGDQAVVSARGPAYVFRVSWVYGNRRQNFLRTIRRAARQRPELRVVADQRGTPTWSRSIAEAVSLAIGHWATARDNGQEVPSYGIYHMAAQDHATWHDFASAIVAGMPEIDGWTRPVVRKISTPEYPTEAARPAWSVLDSSRLRSVFGLVLAPWRQQLAQCTEVES
jgi:dTDP-4-dehydrorhamnose reductase